MLCWRVPSKVQKNSQTCSFQPGEEEEFACFNTVLSTGLRMKKRVTAILMFLFTVLRSWLNWYVQNWFWLRTTDLGNGWGLDIRGLPSFPYVMSHALPCKDWKAPVINVRSFSWRFLNKPWQRPKSTLISVDGVAQLRGSWIWVCQQDHV